MILFVLFEMKRRQRIIPVIAPLRNTTLDFVQTVGNVYFNQRDNKNIAIKKITYFLEFVRSNFFLSTSNMNDEFIEALSKKTAMKQQDKTKLGRRDFLRAIGAGAGVAVTAAAPLATEAIATETDAEKRKARYQANSTDVQTFYKVNRYPS